MARAFEIERIGAPSICGDRACNGTGCDAMLHRTIVMNHL
jgi:hypothetical protein